MSKCTLYRHFDADGALLYVGISLSAVQRLSAHAKSRWADEIARVDVQKFESRSDAESAEIQAIRDEKPLYNIRHVITKVEVCCDAPMNTPEGFRAAKKRLGMSRQNLADALGVNIKTISNWSRGHTNPPLLLALAMETLEARRRS